MSKKGYTTAEMIIVIGVILASLIFFISFRGLIGYEKEKAVSLDVEETGDRIAGIMRRVESEPSYVCYCVKIPKTTVEVKNNFLTIKRDKEIYTKPVPTSSKDFYAKDLLEICISKSKGKIILGKCVLPSTSTTSTSTTTSTPTTGSTTSTTSITSTTSSTTTTIQLTYRVLVIPIDWDNNLNYNAVADYIGHYYLERIPLRNCPQQFKLLKADLSTNYGSSWVNGYCDVSSYSPSKSCYYGNVLHRIYKCAEEYSLSLGTDYDYVVGIDDDDIAMYNGSHCLINVGGWSDGDGGYPSVIAEGLDQANASGVITHELGHEFEFGDQYCDCDGVKADIDNDGVKENLGEEICGNNHPVNPLRSSLGCGGKGDPSCEYSAPTYPYAPGCVWVLGNFDRRAVDTDGDGVPDAGERSAMSNLFYAGQRGHYSSEEYNHLKTDPRLQCI